MSIIRASRRTVLSVVLATGVSFLASPGSAGDLAEINMLINQSPWFDGFRQVVEKYEAETGNTVNLDVTPFPGMLEKTRNSVRSPEGTYDVLAVNTMWMNEVYEGGFVSPIDDIQTGYKLPEGVLDYAETTYWDKEKGAFSSSGKLLGLPLNGNVQVLYYRSDLYAENGLSVPTTWDELYANAEILHNPPNVYGFATRGDRNAAAYNSSGYLVSHGGAFFRDPASNDYTVTINSPESLAGLKTYIRIAKEVGAPNPESITQGKLIQLLATGKAAQAIAVIAAWGQLEDPDKSAVVGKINAALVPAGPNGPASSAGHWVASIPNNIPDARKQASLAFLDWFLKLENQAAYTEFGAVPVRGDLINSELSKQDRFRFLNALSENSEHAIFYAPIKERPEVNSIYALKVNQALLGELTPEQALNEAAEAIHKVMADAGYNTGTLPDLK